MRGATVSADGLLAGRRVLITGGANGIGETVARRFAELGAVGAVLDLPGAIDGAHRSDWPAVAADVTDEHSLQSGIYRCTELLGGIDSVVASAGVVPSWQHPSQLDLTDLDRVLAINVRGVAATIKHTAPLLSSGATIVAVASLNSWKGDPHIAAYAASKHAVLGLVRSAAMALGPDGIRVNCVGPGPIATEALVSRMAARSADTGLEVEVALDAAAAGTALHRIATAREVADVIAFLTSELSNAITGQLIKVDGGIL
jgi:3alpha(or 20beta)-hydroxysteroid dehydrogenase